MISEGITYKVAELYKPHLDWLFLFFFLKYTPDFIPLPVYHPLTLPHPIPPPLPLTNPHHDHLVQPC